MLEILKTDQFDSRHKEIVRPFLTGQEILTYKGVEALEIPWVRPLVGFGWSHPLASHEEPQTTTKGSFY